MVESVNDRDFFSIWVQEEPIEFFCWGNIALNLINILSSKSRVQFKLNEVSHDFKHFPFPPRRVFPLNCSYSKRLNFSSRFHLATFDENLYWQGRFLFTFILLPHDLSSFPSLTLMKDLSREMYSLCVGFQGLFCVATCYDKIIGSSSLYHKKKLFLLSSELSTTVLLFFNSQS